MQHSLHDHCLVPTCSTSCFCMSSYCPDRFCSFSAASFMGRFVNLVPSLRVSSSMYLACNFFLTTFSSCTQSYLNCCLLSRLVLSSRRQMHADSVALEHPVQMSLGQELTRHTFWVILRQRVRVLLVRCHSSFTVLSRTRPRSPEDRRHTSM